MQKFTVTIADAGISEFDEVLGAMWSDHCINPFTSAEIVDDFAILTGKNGEYRGRASFDILANMGEEC